VNGPRVLIEDWLPGEELGIESRREAAPIPGQFPKLKTLHVWWARRPLAASAGAVLASVMPAWSDELSAQFRDAAELQTAKDYQAWFLRLCGILGDPVAARRALDHANANGIKLIGNGYGYKQAYKNSPSASDLNVLHRVLTATWGAVPSVLDPTAGGGSIPYEAIRYGLPSIANDLNAVAAAVLRAGVEMPALYGSELADDLKKWGQVLVDRVRDRLVQYFDLDSNDERVVAYVFAHTVSCPRSGKPVPLSPNWWLSKDKGGTAVRLMTERNGQQLDEVEFEIVTGKAIDTAEADAGTVARGDGVSPWDGLAIDGDHIKAEAQARRMGSQLYAVAVRIGGKRRFRAPTPTDLAALKKADGALREVLPEWIQNGILPDEEIPDGNKTSEPRRYGMYRWRDLFSPRQLLVHGTFVEEFRRLNQEVHSHLGERGDAVSTLLAMMQSKAVNWNALLSSYDVSRQKVRSVFDRHDFSFKWTYAEFEGARELYPWCLEQITDAYCGIAELLEPSEGGGLSGHALAHPVPGPVEVLRENAGDLRSVPDRSQVLVCIDPPYYDNVMYAELADFFYVWEKHTLGLVWPELFEDELTDKKNEAVTNLARFVDTGKKKKDLANADYEAKMTAIFAECHRVLRDDGVLTVMFTHKRAEAWDTLGMGLMEAGFTIETSWPVNTESEQSLHQADQNAASSTILLVCRRRVASTTEPPFFEDLEADVRAAARHALVDFAAQGIEGVDLLLSTYGPALAVISAQWPVYSSEADPITGKSRLLRPEEALDAAREEVVKVQRRRLVGHEAQLDPYTDFVMIAWDAFRAASFPFDEARRLALAIGGLEIDELERARVLTKKAGTVTLCEPKDRRRRQADHDSGLPGVYPGATQFAATIDALHTVMYVADMDGLGAAKTLIDRAALASDPAFLAALQGLVRAIPHTKAKGEWVRPEAGTLDALCAAYFPEIDVPDADGAPEPVPELFPQE
jgi:adenine-specific DNA methylase